MGNQTHKPKRRTRRKSATSQEDLDIHALQLENLRLQREIAKLKAQHVSELNRLRIEAEEREDKGPKVEDLARRIRDMLAKEPDSSPEAIQKENPSERDRAKSVAALDAPRPPRR